MNITRPLIILALLASISFHLSPAFGKVNAGNENKKTAAELHAEGLKYYNAGQYRETIEVWLKEFAIDVANANTANNVGIAYRKLGEHNTAIKYHKKAIELNPNFGKAYNCLGIVYYEMEDYQKALVEYQKAVDLKFDIGCMYHNIGLVYINLEDYKKAEEATLKAIELKYDLATSYLNLGHIYFMTRDYKKADKAFRKAREINPTLKMPELELGAISEAERVRFYPFIRILNIFLFSILGIGTPLLILLFFRFKSKYDFLKPNPYKVFLLFIILLFFPTPFIFALPAGIIWMPIAIGLTPPIYILGLSLSLAESMLGWWKVSGFFIALFFYLALVFGYYLLTSILYKLTQNRVLLLVIMSFLIAISFFDIYKFGNAGGGGFSSNVIELYKNLQGYFMATDIEWR